MHVLRLLPLLVLLSPIMAQIEVPAPIRDAVASGERPLEDRERDARRKPDQVLAFLEVAPGDKVADLMTGLGYYTEILSRVVGKDGRVISHNAPFVVNRFYERLGPGGIWFGRVESSQWRSNVKQRIAYLEKPQLGRDLDMVMMVLFYHDTYWQRVNRVAMNKAVFNSLKPGGVFGIVDHSAKPGSGARDVLSLHRVDKALVIEELKAAGFIYDGELDVLAHREDTRDYNVFRDFNSNRDNTDRFILKFRRP